MSVSHDRQTIVAQCTPQGSGAIALIRLSGDDAFIIAERISILQKNKKITTVPSHTVHYGSVIDSENKTIDHALFIVMHGPHTFTGQNVVEITTHNNQFLIESVIHAAIYYGARLAEQGEFTRRAVLNDKIDLIQAEAVNELIHANTQLALKKSLSQLEGSFSYWINTIEKKLIHALALSEASFEFIDEEDISFGKPIKTMAIDIIETIKKIKETFDVQQHIRQGIRIALIGSVNAGKSSLFNALLKKERAIVTNIAGTTRDVIEAGLYRNNNHWTLIDTAGLRQTDNFIEQQGIERSRSEAQSADIILLVFDGSSELTKQECALYNELYNSYASKTLVIKNKSDIAHASSLFNPSTEILTVSAFHHKGIDFIEHAIEKKIKDLFAHLESPFLLNTRQYNLLLHVEQKLNTLILLLDNPEYEIISYHLNDILAHLSELTGKSISEAGMDAVFRNFCIGK